MKATYLSQVDECKKKWWTLLLLLSMRSIKLENLFFVLKLREYFRGLTVALAFDHHDLLGVKQNLLA